MNAIIYAFDYLNFITKWRNRSFCSDEKNRPKEKINHSSLYVLIQGGIYLVCQWNARNLQIFHQNENSVKLRMQFIVFDYEISEPICQYIYRCRSHLCNVMKHLQTLSSLSATFQRQNITKIDLTRTTDRGQLEYLKHFIWAIKLKYTFTKTESNANNICNNRIE